MFYCPRHNVVCIHQSHYAVQCSISGTEFNLDSVKVGELIGAGIWPFAISIILFSLVIDRIGYKVAMLFSFVCFALYLTLGLPCLSKVQGVEGEALVAAQKAGYDLMYLASIILALG